MNKLLDLMAETKRTEFEFVDLKKDYDSNGKPVAVFTLKEAMVEVEGSQRDQITGERINAYDVTQIKMHEEDMQELSDDEFVPDPANPKKAGKLSTDLRLDVAKSTGEVWVKATSFAISGREMRDSRKINRRALLVEAMRKSADVSSPAPAAKPEAQKVQPVVTK